MNLVSKLRLTITLGACLCYGAVSQSSSRMSGAVIDENASRVEGATLTFHRESGDISARTAQDGSYSLALKPGHYTATVRHEGFCEWHRPGFVIQPNNSIRFDFELIACPRAHGMVLQDKKVTGEIERYVGPYKCEMLDL